jgi:hypothetical protein
VYETKAYDWPKVNQGIGQFLRTKTSVAAIAGNATPTIVKMTVVDRFVSTATIEAGGLFRMVRAERENNRCSFVLAALKAFNSAKGLQEEITAVIKEKICSTATVEVQLTGSAMNSEDY